MAATNTSPRDLVTQQINYIRKRITYEDAGTTITVGYLPGGAVVCGGGVQVVTAFDGSGTDLLDVGFIGATTDANAYATSLSLAAVGFIALDELAATTNIQQEDAFTVTCLYTDQNSDATAGVADVVVWFIPDNDG